MHRIPYGKSASANGSRPAVFFQHGLLCSSFDWVSNLPNESAGFLFADAGFDVCLGNMRGNTYSRAHVNLSTTDEAFWQFTWYDMMLHDLDAMIDTVLTTTGQSSLYYAGHSQGTMTMFTKLSIDQTFAPKIRKFFALAPVCTLHYIKGLLKVVSDLSPVLSIFYDTFGQDEFLPNSAWQRLAAQDICGLETNVNPLCQNFVFLMGGPDSNAFNKSRIPVFISQMPAGTSSLNILHYSQMIKSGKLQAYDWGSAQANIAHYGTAVVPTYNISTVNVTTYIYRAGQDWLSDPQDVESYILPNINPAIVAGDLFLPEYNHFDFIWGLNATKDIYQPIIDIIASDQQLTG